ncbi:MAG TPA: hypothetical protein VMT20_07690 [Terriglobia bacterium]|nr:hypothetical protein [Terriglobia bacterium]
MANERHSFADRALAPVPLDLPTAPLPTQILLPLGELHALRQPSNPASPKMKPKPVSLNLRGRCVEKGCVFPAAPGLEGRCLHHGRQQQEPGLYSSHQPSSALVGRGKFGPPRAEEFEPGAGKRGLDRRRLMAERERFLNEQP